MAISASIKKQTVARQRGNLIYYFNPRIVARDGVVFFEDFMTNTMDAKQFYENFYPYKNEDILPDEETKYLWDNGIVQVGNYSILRFFSEDDPIIQQLFKEYQAASEEEKPDVHIKLSQVGLDREGALEDEVARLKAELEAAKRALSETTGKRSKTTIDKLTNEIES